MHTRPYFLDSFGALNLKQTRPLEVYGKLNCGYVPRDWGLGSHFIKRVYAQREPYNINDFMKCNPSSEVKKPEIK